MTDETTPAGRAQQSTEGPGTGSGSPRQSQASAVDDWPVDALLRLGQWQLDDYIRRMRLMLRDDVPLVVSYGRRLVVSGRERLGE